MIKRFGNGKIQVTNDSIYASNPEADGHINRNIRLALTILEMSKPYIEIVSYIEKADNKVEIKWRVNGCYTINEARALVNYDPNDDEA
jgi:hypothetical protein